MNKTKQALQTFKEGLNCAQAVFNAFAEEYGIDKGTALRISCGFGGGMARTDQVCGAVSGAVMVIGAKYAKPTKTDAEDKEKMYQIIKDRTYLKIKEFTEEFKKRNINLGCSALIGCNMSTPEGLEKAKKIGAHTNLCPKFVQDAVEILEAIL